MHRVRRIPGSVVLSAPCDSCVVVVHPWFLCKLVRRLTLQSKIGALPGRIWYDSIHRSIEGVLPACPLRHNAGRPVQDPVGLCVVWRVFALISCEFYGCQYVWSSSRTRVVEDVLAQFCAAYGVWLLICSSSSPMVPHVIDLLVAVRGLDSS